MLLPSLFFVYCLECGIVHGSAVKVYLKRQHVVLRARIDQVIFRNCRKVTSVEMEGGRSTKSLGCDYQDA
jgi:uncharacterized Zn finger protein